MLEGLPAFSVIYETENLGSLKLENIYPSLDSIAAQDIPMARAREFLIMDSGDVPARVLQRLCSKYRWIQVRRIEPDTGYYEAKMKGAAMAVGEIVLFCDSDCVYAPQWLRHMLTFFAEHPEATMVAGETSTVIRNPYELAVSMSYFFPRFSRKKEPYLSDHYFCNNVGFRRNFLLKHPIPSNLPLFRGNCLLHADVLCRFEGESLWKHPLARATHEPPEMSFAFWRHLHLGRDRVIRRRLLREISKKYPGAKSASKKEGLEARCLKASEIPQIFSVLRQDPKRLWMLPLAIPISLFLTTVFMVGRLMTYLSPKFLLHRYEAIERKKAPAKKWHENLRTGPPRLS